jgi:predicted nucleic acid-binding protein
VRLLADTGALLAYLLKNDGHHRDALAFVRQHPEARFVVTSLILSELVSRLRARAGAARAAAAGRSLLDSRRYSVVFVDAPLVRSALARMEQFHDKPLSLTDCASFELIDRLGLDGSFAFDRDFRDCGYRMVP